MRIVLVIGTLLGLIVGTTPASALNWEGHDDWFVDPVFIESFTRNLPPPIPRLMPACSEREAAHRANAYEQIAVPGVNCRAPNKPVK